MRQFPVPSAQLAHPRSQTNSSQKTRGNKKAVARTFAISGGGREKSGGTLGTRRSIGGRDPSRIARTRAVGGTLAVKTIASRQRIGDGRGQASSGPGNTFITR